METRPKSSWELRAEKAEAQCQHLRAVLYVIAHYDSPEWLRRNSEKRYGVDYTEGLEMAYENMQCEARDALKAVPKRRREVRKASPAVDPHVADTGKPSTRDTSSSSSDGIVDGVTRGGDA